jgi:CRP-like cAMP-binding protein
MDFKKYQKVLQKNIIFENMTEDEIERGLKFFSARVGRYEKGDILNVVSDPMECFGIVLLGVVHVCMTDYEGQKTIMATVSSGDGFGESLSFLGCDSDVYIRAAEDCEVLWLKCDNIKNATSQSGENNLFVQRFIKDLANRTLKMNDRIQILSKHTLREKLVAFFKLQADRDINNGSESKTKTLNLPLDRNGMAVYLGVDRSSLSRELSKMKSEGLIDFNKNKFKILY